MTLGLNTTIGDGTVGWGSIVNNNFSLINTAIPVNATAFTAGGQNAYNTGLGAINQLVGPTDQPFAVVAGAPNTATSAGNYLNLTAGAGGATSGAGGQLSLTGGAGTGGSAGGGGVSIAAGGGAPTGLGGAVFINAGAGGATSGGGGSILITAGSSTSGSGGLVSISGGFAGGMNVAGTNCTMTTGQGTGNAASGNVKLQTGFIKASGTSLQTIGDRIFACGSSKSLSLTSGTATTFALLSTTSNSAIGCTVFYTVELNDGTNWSTVAGSYNASAVNKTGTTSVSGGATSTQSAVANAGTIGCASAATTSGTSLALEITPTWTVLVPTLTRLTYTIIANGLTTITPQ